MSFNEQKMNKAFDHLIAVVKRQEEETKNETYSFFYDGDAHVYNTQGALKQVIEILDFYRHDEALTLFVSSIISLMLNNELRNRTVNYHLEQMYRNATKGMGFPEFPAQDLSFIKDRFDYFLSGKNKAAMTRAINAAQKVISESLGLHVKAFRQSFGFGFLNYKGDLFVVTSAQHFALDLLNEASKNRELILAFNEQRNLENLLVRVEKVRQ